MRNIMLAVGAILALTAWPAQADSPSPIAVAQPVVAGSNAVGACLTAGHVWLLVVDDRSEVISNQCVDTPTSGEDALRLAGLAVTKAKQGYLCTIGGYPEKCPSRYEGEYWNYHHASLTQAWRYSNDGAGQHRPEPGTIEGWCYNAEHENRCTPPTLRIIVDGAVRLPPGASEAALIDPAPVVRAVLPPPEPVPLGTLVSIGVVVLVGVAAVAFARRQHAG